MATVTARARAEREAKEGCPAGRHQVGDTQKGRARAGGWVGERREAVGLAVGRRLLP